MSKNRMINTRFWMDNFIENCDPIEKLLFLYLLTNNETNLLGIYEIAIRRIAFDSGIDKDMVLKIFDRFEKAGKAMYLDGHVVLHNFTKHQKYNGKMLTSAKNSFEVLPNSLISNEKMIPILKGIERVCKGYIKPFDNINLNSNLNLNTNINSNSNLKEKEEVKESTFFLNESDNVLIEEQEEVQSDIKLNTEDKRKKVAPKKEKFGEHQNVMLTEDECKKLRAKYSMEDINWIIEKLSNFKLSKGKTYKSDYGAINTWVIQALEDHKKKSNGSSIGSTKNNGNAFTRLAEEIDRRIQFGGT